MSLPLYDRYYDPYGGGGYIPGPVSGSGGGTATVDGLHVYRSVDSLTGSGSSLAALDGTGWTNGDMVLINTLQDGEWIASNWRVIKPAAAATDLTLGIVRLLDNSAHLVRTGGF